MKLRIPPRYMALTLKSHERRFREIITDCTVMLPSRPEDKIKGPEYRTKALWDTGATNCAITSETIKNMGLKPVTRRYVNHADGRTLANVYLINVVLPNRVIFTFIKATECKDTAGKFGIIIGMDIICTGDFAVTNVGGKSMMSFRVPSQETIDYVEDFRKMEEKQHTPIIASKSVGRNDLCPCGSGRKYKYCCGRTRA